MLVHLDYFSMLALLRMFTKQQCLENTTKRITSTLNSPVI